MIKFLTAATSHQLLLVGGPGTALVVATLGRRGQAGAGQPRCRLQTAAASTAALQEASRRPWATAAAPPRPAGEQRSPLPQNDPWDSAGNTFKWCLTMFGISSTMQYEMKWRRSSIYLEKTLLGTYTFIVKHRLHVCCWAKMTILDPVLVYS